MGLRFLKGKRLFGVAVSRDDAAAPVPGDPVHLLMKQEGSVHAQCGALSPCTVTTVSARVTCAACRAATADARPTFICHYCGKDGTAPWASVYTGPDSWAAAHHACVPPPEPTCANAPTAAAHLNARLDRAEELVRSMTQMGDEVRALVQGIAEDVVVLAQAMARGEVQASELLPFVSRWEKIKALAEAAQARWSG